MASLLGLPPEIRSQIYHELFESQKVMGNPKHYVSSDGSPETILVASPILNILFVCHQIYEEAFLLFYSTIKFCFRRHNTSITCWSADEVMNAYPPFRIRNKGLKEQNSANVVQHIFYAGNDEILIHRLGVIFPQLKLFEFDLDWDHLGNDQTNYDRAMKYAIRHKEWRHAVEDALTYRFIDGVAAAVFSWRTWDDLNHCASVEVPSEDTRSGRAFRFVMHWRLEYRFLSFVGTCDLDQWVLHVRDAEGKSKNVYDIRQDVPDASLTMR